jgi:hypothetical protein
MRAVCGCEPSTAARLHSRPRPEKTTQQKKAHATHLGRGLSRASSSPSIPSVLCSR